MFVYFVCVCGARECSQNIDDSPVSDNKMDISEPTTTISQESLGLSPETELKTNHSIAASDSMSILTNDVSLKTNASLTNSSVVDKNSRTTKMDSKITNIHHTSNDQHDNKYDDSSLDNRSLYNKNTLTNSKQRIGMTLVDMHPLMASPSKSDDDMSPVSPTKTDITYNFQNKNKNEKDSFDALEQQEKQLKLQQHNQQEQIQNQQLQQLNRASNENPKQTLLLKSYISSDESEPDLSQYQALVEPTFQAVSLTNQSLQTVADSKQMNSSYPKVNSLRKISLTAELMVTHEDDSSVETFSNNSFDDDCDVDEDEDDDEMGFNEANTLKSNNIQSLGCEAGISNACVMMNNSDEHQMTTVVITLPDGQTRDIDMKVIEPYKRCLSHGGYLKQGGNNAIVIFSACYLPDRSRTDYHYVMENLFL